jgi:hypothetical protein
VNGVLNGASTAVITAILTITGGSGKYAGATGTITLEGQAHNVFGGAGMEFSMRFIKVPSAVRIFKATETERCLDKVRSSGTWGEYVALAWEQVETGAAEDPEFHKPFESNSRHAVAE